MPLSASLQPSNNSPPGRNDVKVHRTAPLLSTTTANPPQKAHNLSTRHTLETGSPHKSGPGLTTSQKTAPSRHKLGVSMQHNANTTHVPAATENLPPMAHHPTPPYKTPRKVSDTCSMQTLSVSRNTAPPSWIQHGWT